MSDKEQKPTDEANPEVILQPEDGKEVDFRHLSDRGPLHKEPAFLTDDEVEEMVEEIFRKED